MFHSVVVVEDDAAIRTEVEHLIDGAGFDVHGAANELEALRVLDRLARPCLVLWDALSVPYSEALFARAAMSGTQIATLPMVLGRSANAPTDSLKKRLVGKDTIVTTVRGLCRLRANITDEV